MTSDQKRDFEHQWPALAIRVNRLMRRKKISPWLAEDLTQETGLRLIRMWPKIDQAQPLWPLVTTIALNLMRDEMRRDGSRELMCAVPDAPSTENVERRGLARLELRAVGGAMSQMAEAQRQVLIAEVADPLAEAPDASATRMLRMRARRKLQGLLDHASLLGIAVGDHMRRIVREAEVVISRVLPANPEHVSAAAISLLAALSLGIAIGPDSPSSAAEADSSRGRNVSYDTTATSSAGSTRAGHSDVGRRYHRGPGTGRHGADARRPRRDRGGGNERGPGGDQPFPGAVNYGVSITDDTYVNGTLQVEVVGDEEAGARDADQPEGPGSINCTVSPESSAASCSHSGEGWSERGVRANHNGEAVVAGHHVY